MPFKKTYSYTEVRRMITDSEARNSCFGHAAHGHASAQHQVIDDAALKDRLKGKGLNSGISAFKDKATTNFGGTMKTSDQAFLLAEILNSKLGQAALGALDAAVAGNGGTATNPVVRLSIGYPVANSNDFNLREAKFSPALHAGMGLSMMDITKNPQQYATVNPSTPMQQILAIMDSAYEAGGNRVAALQIVTCYPTSTANVDTYGKNGGYSTQVQGGVAAVTQYVL
jgi:hypothetical protein